MKKFWNWTSGKNGERVLRLEGPIDADKFWGDEITPDDFRKELESGSGDVTVWLNSPGGNVFAAASIYTMLKDYDGKITVKIDAIAASAASVVAMAGDEVIMSPVAMLMIHDPATIAMGNAKDFQKAIDTLNEVKASIINAYELKTGLSRAQIAKMMEKETWLNANAAKELGFCDGIMDRAWKAGGSDEEDPDEPDEPEEPDKDEPEEKEKVKTKKAAASAVSSWSFSARLTDEAVLEGLKDAAPGTEEEPEAEEQETVVLGMDGRTKDGAVPFDILSSRLNLLK